ncbi:MAG: TonB-dependent receptor [Bacteroidales bacterium]
MKRTNNETSSKSFLREMLRPASLFVLAATVGTSAVSAASAETMKLTISLKNASLNELFEAIEKQSDYSVIVNTNEVDVTRQVSVNSQDNSIDRVLQDVLSKQDLAYEIKDRHIIIYPQETKKNQQTRTITGMVVDEFGDPIIGANVTVKGSPTGNITNENGQFSLPVTDQSVLVISYIGYGDQEIKVGDKTSLHIVLKEDTQLLEDVVVVGFGTQKKVNLTGAVSAVKMDEVLGDRPVTSLGSVLQGSIPGFTASSSPVPGGGNSWNIRGLESINGGSPLILVDNVVFNSLSLLNPADIESVSVLKDASAAAIYGARASFGVVLITTKKGTNKEKLSVSYNNNFAFSKVTNLPELASPSDMIRTLKEGGYSSIWSGQNIDTYMGLLDEYVANPSLYEKGWTEVKGTKYFLRETGIMGEMFEPAFKQNHNISAQGGSETINYRLSFGYTDEDGVMVTNKDSYSRTNVSSYVNGKITSWLSTSLDIKYNSGKKRYPVLDGKSELGFWSTILPSYHPVGSLPYGTDGDEYPVMTPKNVIQLTNASKTVTDDTRILSRTVVNPIEGLDAVLEYSFQRSEADYEAYANSFKVHQGLAESIKPSTSTTPFSTSRETTKYTTINAFLSYNKTFVDKHNVSAIAGYNQEYNDYRYLFSQAFNMISNELPSLSGTDGVTPPETRDSYGEYALRSGFFRAGYNYKSTYFLEFNGRYDLSSKFPKNYRAGFFPSVSGGWTITNESFMQSITPVLSSFKLRGSYGTLGNQNINNYGFLATMGVVDAGWIFDGLVPKTVNAPGMVRANYTWEEVESINGGFDFGFVNNQLTGSFDIYRRNTTGMLGPGEELPSVGGATAPMQNAADMKTNGWELAVNWKDRIGALSYGVGFNVYDSKSVITKYKNETKLLSASYYEGQQIGEIWGYVTDGFYTADDFDETGALKEGVVRINGVTSHVGDIKFKNLRDDESSTNVINTGDDTATNPGDRKVIGNNRARYQYGINGFAEYKGFGLSFLLQGVGKRDAWIGGNLIFPMSGQYGTVYKDQVGKIWTEENSENAWYGRIYENAGSSQGANQRVSDKFLSDASYLRVKNITLSYSFPQRLIRPLQLSNLKCFVSGENLFTFDHLPSGVDPETLGWGYPFSRTISFGINLNL